MFAGSRNLIESLGDRIWSIRTIQYIQWVNNVIFCLFHSRKNELKQNVLSCEKRMGCTVCSHNSPPPKKSLCRFIPVWGTSVDVTLLDSFVSKWPPHNSHHFSPIQTCSSQYKCKPNQLLSNMGKDLISSSSLTGILLMSSDVRNSVGWFAKQYQFSVIRKWRIVAEKNCKIYWTLPSYGQSTNCC